MMQYCLFRKNQLIMNEPGELQHFYLLFYLISLLLPLPTVIAAPGDLIEIFTGHNNAVRSIFVSGEYLFSGSDDHTIKQ